MAQQLILDKVIVGTIGPFFPSRNLDAVLLTQDLL
jgi:hypothetical protein